MYASILDAVGVFAQNLFTFDMLLAVLLGCVGGMLIGAMPGMSATMGIVLFLPLTYSMATIPALTMLMATYTCAIMGGSFTAILVSTPGTTASAATAIDGYQLTQKGKAMKALGTSLFASCIGGIISALALMFLSPPLASLSLQFNSAEYFLLGCFGLCIIASLASGSYIKGLLSGCIGLLLSTIGTEGMTGYTRYAFGVYNLFDGLNSTVVLIGIFSIGQMLWEVQELTKKKEIGKAVLVKQEGSILLTVKEIIHLAPTIIRSSIIGVFTGILPGAGGSIGSYIAYNEAKRRTKDPEFGSGCLEGVAAPEAANNAVTGGAMIPLLTLGIPGSPAAAVLLGGLLIQGMIPGTTLFTEQATTTYAIIIGFLLTNLLMYPLGILVARFVGNVTKVKKEVLIPIIIVASVIGSYCVKKSMFDVLVMAIFGFVGYLMKKYNFLPSALVLGLLLGSITENGLRRSILMSRGDVFSYYIHRPACLVLFALIVIFAIYPIVSQKLHEKKAAKQEAEQK